MFSFYLCVTKISLNLVFDGSQSLHVAIMCLAHLDDLLFLPQVAHALVLNGPLLIKENLSLFHGAQRVHTALLMVRGSHDLAHATFSDPLDLVRYHFFLNQCVWTVRLVAQTTVTTFVK